MAEPSPLTDTPTATETRRWWHGDDCPLQGENCARLLINFIQKNGGEAMYWGPHFLFGEVAKPAQIQVRTPTGFDLVVSPGEGLEMTDEWFWVETAASKGWTVNRHVRVFRPVPAEEQR